jgi:hypothetical protein
MARSDSIAGTMKRRQTITLTIIYDDPTGSREPPSSWDWQALMAMAMHGHGPEAVKVGICGPVKDISVEPPVAPA